MIPNYVLVRVATSPMFTDVYFGELVSRTELTVTLRKSFRIKLFRELEKIAENGVKNLEDSCMLSSYLSGERTLGFCLESLTCTVGAGVTIYEAFTACVEAKKKADAEAAEKEKTREPQGQLQEHTKETYRLIGVPSESARCAVENAVRRMFPKNNFRPIECFMDGDKEGLAFTSKEELELRQLGAYLEKMTGLTKATVPTEFLIWCSKRRPVSDKKYLRTVLLRLNRINQTKLSYTDITKLMSGKKTIFLSCIEASLLNALGCTLTVPAKLTKISRK